MNAWAERASTAILSGLTVSGFMPLIMGYINIAAASASIIGVTGLCLIAYVLHKEEKELSNLRNTGCSNHLQSKEAIISTEIKSIKDSCENKN